MNASPRALERGRPRAFAAVLPNPATPHHPAPTTRGA
jgi:hypothetical protein